MKVRGSFTMLSVMFLLHPIKAFGVLSGCPSKNLVEGTSSAYGGNYAYYDEWRRIKYSSITSADELAKVSAQSRLLGEKTRDCLYGHASTLAASKHYPLWQKRLSDPVELHEGIETRFEWEHRAALTWLYPAMREDQDPLAALRAMQQAQQNWINSIAEASRKLPEYQARRAEHLESQQRWNRLGNALGNVLVGNAQDLSNSEVIARTLFSDLELQQEFSDNLDELKRQDFDSGRTGLDKDGVRISLLRLAGGAAMGEETPHLMHNNQILRLRVGNSSCTAFPLGRTDVVMTNRHCVVNDENKLISPRKMVVSSDRSGFDMKSGSLIPIMHEYSTKASVRKYVVPVATHVNRVQNDWAILYLSENPILHPPLYAMSSNSTREHISDDSRIALAGYSSDLNNGAYITMHWGCGFSVEGDVIEHSCRRHRGASGSPIVFSSGKLKGWLVGIHAQGQYTEGQKYSDRGSGPYLSSFLRYVVAALKEVREGKPPPEELYAEVASYDGNTIKRRKNDGNQKQ